MWPNLDHVVLSLPVKCIRKFNFTHFDLSFFRCQIPEGAVNQSATEWEFSPVSTQLNIYFCSFFAEMGRLLGSALGILQWKERNCDSGPLQRGSAWAGRR